MACHFFLNKSSGLDPVWKESAVQKEKTAGPEVGDPAPTAFSKEKTFSYVFLPQFPLWVSVANLPSKFDDGLVSIHPRKIRHMDPKYNEQLTSLSLSLSLFLTADFSSGSRAQSQWDTSKLLVENPVHQ